jgi:RNA polymerase sigma factor (sigma-70 family)
VFPSTYTSTTTSGAGTGFKTTQWSVVLASARSEGAQRDEAIGRLYQTYRYPLYAFIRRRGYNVEDAKDLTQGFFARLLDKNYFKTITVEGGRFRSYLLTLLNYFLADEREREWALKRGGGQSILAIEDELGENHYQIEPVEDVTPESLFERSWARTLLDEVMAKLCGEYMADGKAELFAALRPCLTGAERLLPYSELGRHLGMRESAVKQAVRRLRVRYGELLWTEIAATVENPEEIESEIRHLIGVASG